MLLSISKQGLKWTVVYLQTPMEPLIVADYNHSTQLWSTF